jgi:branched-chain amino acid transport system ATP-binding protein
MLSLSRVDVFYGRAQVLFGLSLEATEGEVVALLGRNGAGKTTTLKTIIGLVPAAAGEIVYEGRALRRRPPYAVARLGVGFVPEERRIFGGLTVMGNLMVGRRPPRRGLPPWTLERLFELFPNLAEARRRLGGELSGGEQKMLALARTLMGNPRLLLLDEPTEGLAPLIVRQMAEAIETLKRAGLTVVMSEQNLRFATALADRAYVIERGRIALSGTMAELAEQDQVWRKYLAV